MRKLINTIFVIVLLVAISKAFSGAFLDVILVLMGVIMGLLIFNKTDKKVNDILKYAFLIRVAAAIISYSGIFPLEGSLSDAVMFIQWGETYSRLSYEQIITSYLFAGGDFYSVVIGFIFKFFTVSELLLVFLNVYLSTYTVYLTFRIASLLYNSDIARTGAWVIAFIPYSIIFGVTVTKEPLMTFLLIFSIYHLIYFKNYGNPKNVFYSLSSIYFSVFLHGAMIVPFVLVSIITILFAFKFNKNFGSMLLGVISAIMFGMILLYFLQGGVKIYKLEFLAEGGSEVKYEVFRNSGSSIQDNNYRNKIEINSIYDYIFYLPSALIPFLYQPYPWRIWEMKRYILLFAGSGIWLIISILWLRNRKLIYTSPDAKFVLIICIAVLFTYAFGSSQINQAIRHNHKVMPLVVSIMSIHFYKLFNKKQKYLVSTIQN